jgi:GNAT superfamily N-acetyltransferase
MIRRALLRDVEPIAELFERSFALLDFLPTLHTREEHLRWFGGLVSDHETWVWDDDGALAGFYVLRGDELADLYLEPAMIGRGIGHALFEHATQQRPAGFELWCFQQNERARTFYERHDCRAVRFTNGAGNEERMPDVLYEWRAKSTSSVATVPAVRPGAV